MALPDDPPSARVRFLLWMAGRFGIQSVLPMVVARLFLPCQPGVLLLRFTISSGRRLRAS